MYVYPFPHCTYVYYQIDLRVINNSRYSFCMATKLLLYLKTLRINDNKLKIIFMRDYSVWKDGLFLKKYRINISTLFVPVQACVHLFMKVFFFYICISWIVLCYVRTYASNFQNWHLLYSFFKFSETLENGPGKFWVRVQLFLILILKYFWLSRIFFISRIYMYVNDTYIYTFATYNL